MSSQAHSAPQTTPEAATPPVRYARFSAAQRFEHLVLMVAVIGLALTGLPQKFAAEAWAKTVIELWGGIESARILHRFLALLLTAEAIYHVGAVAFRLFVLRRGASLLPRGRDLRDARDWLLHNLGLRRAGPKMPHYNFINKLDYWLSALGLLVLIVTGFILWNPIAATRRLPGEAIPTARVVHGEQAVLLVILVVIWHGYHVLIRRLNLSIFSGRLSRRAMQADHAEALAALEAGILPEEVPGRESRARLFWPVALVALALSGVLVYSLVAGEQTALATVPGQEVEIFAPQFEPAQGDSAVGAALWRTVRCALCHGQEAEGGTDGVPALRGTALTFEVFYRQVRNGGSKMPSFRAEELPDAYLMHLYAWLIAPR